MSGHPGPRLWNLVAELTYRCPLRCVYCSNPLDFAAVRDALDAAAWSRVFGEAAELGAVHVGLTGGEPTARGDLAEIVAGAAAAGLYTHLITAGIPLGEAGLDELCGAGLRSIQLSFQDDRPDEAERISGTRAFEAKRIFAGAVRARGLPLALNVVLHRGNLERIPELVALARSLGAHRLELAHVQYHGWALANREALLPQRAQVEGAARAVARARREPGAPEITLVLPDYFSERPKPCMGGWGRRTLVVDPNGRALPCHAAAGLPGLEFYSVQEHTLAACWLHAPGMNAFRGESWMPEPCRSCPERSRDFGGCRCQAFQLTGDAARTDPACALAPDRATLEAAHRRATARAPLRLRGAAG